MAPRSLLYVQAAVLALCLCENADAFVPSSTSKSSKSKLRYKSSKNDENEINSDTKMIKTEELQPIATKPSMKIDKKIDPTALMSLDKYHFTTKSNKELIFDERAGRFFETSIRPGSLHQLWQEYLKESDDKKVFTKTKPIQTTSFANDMVRTEILFGTSSSSYQEEETFVDEEEEIEECLVHTPYQDSCQSTPWNSLEDFDEYELAKKKKDGWSPPTIVDECYKAWNQRDTKAAAECFSSSVQYKDYQYLGTISSRQQLQEHLERQANLLPPNCQVVVDYLAHDVDNGKIATQWHLERPDGSTVKFTKGCSFYTLDQASGLIKSGYRTSEMAVKPNRDAVNSLLSLAPRLPAAAASNSSTKDNSDKSVVERYFDAWNRRDMEAALTCLDKNCVYQTEDPVFVGTLNGKEEIREHLVQNAKVLPAGAKIVLDDLAVDTTNRNAIGTRWHLEVNGVALPNLNGCSMYTTDPKTGKIKTALDITEAPVKLPREALSFLWAPAVALFDLN